MMPAHLIDVGDIAGADKSSGQAGAVIADLRILGLVGT